MSWIKDRPLPFWRRVLHLRVFWVTDQHGILRQYISGILVGTKSSKKSSKLSKLWSFINDLYMIYTDPKWFIYDLLYTDLIQTNSHQEFLWTITCLGWTTQIQKKAPIFSSPADRVEIVSFWSASNVPISIILISSFYIRSIEHTVS